MQIKPVNKMWIMCGFNPNISGSNNPYNPHKATEARGGNNADYVDYKS